jgi:hypothetical protein
LADFGSFSRYSNEQYSAVLCGALLQAIARSGAVHRKVASKYQNAEQTIEGLAVEGRATIAPRDPRDVKIREHLVAMVEGRVSPADMVVQLKGKLAPGGSLFETAYRPVSIPRTSSSSMLTAAANSNESQAIFICC